WLSIFFTGYRSGSSRTKEREHMNQIYVGKEYGIDFYGQDDELLKDMSFDSEEERDALYDALGEDEHHPEWPDDAVRISGWSRDIYRQPILGIDYGPGHLKYRFGGGYVPRSTYQYHGKE
ncbi:MAG: hypothetical protein KDE47_04790, partial [Caldilineaceae bacterium]|nr:hypothetical protein [Caldilineaceae bacterium]